MSAGNDILAFNELSKTPLDDAALDRAIPAALIMAFLNSGQACAAGTRLLVPKSRLDAVKKAICEGMRALTIGDPADPKTAVGPMVSDKQYERVQSYIRNGIEEGAEVLVQNIWPRAPCPEHYCDLGLSQFVNPMTQRFPLPQSRETNQFFAEARRRT